MDISKLDLEKTKQATIVTISEELWKDRIASNDAALTYSLHVNFLADEITAKLSLCFFTKAECEIEFDWYTSWWQELRTKILPSWWLNRYPSKREIKQKKKVFSAYPSIRISDIEHAASIQYQDAS